MWTKSQLSRIMLVRVKHKSSWTLSIPMSFMVFDELMDAFEDCVWLSEGLFPRWKQKKLYWKGKIMNYTPAEAVSVGVLIRLSRELLYELRKYKRWKLAEVDVEDVHVTVEFF